MQLGVAAVGGSFEGEIAMSDKAPPKACSIKVSGAGTLGHGNGSARFQIEPEGPDASRLTFQGAGEIGGLVAGAPKRDRKSTRLNSSHHIKSYNIFCFEIKTTSIH